MTNLAVVGGGVIGLSAAWRAAAKGHQVTLYDPEPVRGGASWLAGGMLAPVTEAWPGEEDVLRLGEESLRRWPDFARDLGKEGADPGLAGHGTLVVAFDSADAGHLDILAGHLHSLGRAAERLTGREVKRLEPGAGSVRSGLHVPGDLAVDNRKLLEALYAACVNHQVRFVRERVEELPDAEAVVLAAGAWTGRLHPALADAVRPLKGEILRLRPRRGCLPPPTHTVRAVVEGRPIYLVPRGDQELVLGATQYEAGFDQAVTARGVRELLEGAERVFPAITEYELTETAAGLRAGSRDALPYLGVLDGSVFAATGHHRNGLLMAPVTADAVVAWLEGEKPPEGTEAASPARLHQKEHV
ncbi:glycine oxidase ThiO [Amycolatopsis sp. DG1A-15b]|uniref:glycine oxidase ThiO n=1 Tax=Amycolatopsis sp. DG1A-15b TaxID=3052846 RepID=UPI00255B8603|nr:glycine oxidase ThiO [Amycolatopsis sp. DG1A-15b]WIX86104.1 glycine oxidase ThiO [Amycolatopsis sp. DG1A-15b]